MVLRLSVSPLSKLCGRVENMVTMAESDKGKSNVILTAAKEVSFSCVDMSILMDTITSASARADVFKQVIVSLIARHTSHVTRHMLKQVIMSSISDRSNVALLEQRLNPRDLDSVIKQMGILYVCKGFLQFFFVTFCRGTILIRIIPLDITCWT